MKKFDPNIIVLLVLAVFFTVPAKAEIFKVVDENGKVHYTDRKPTGDRGSSQKINLSSNNSNSNSNKSNSSLSIPSVRKASPIRNVRKKSGKSIVLEHFAIALEGEYSAENAEIGNAYVYTQQAKRVVYGLLRGNGSANSALSCNPKGSLKTLHAKHIVTKSNFTKVAHQIIEEYGYVSANADTKFALQQSIGSDLSLSAEIIDMRLALCDTGLDKSLKGYTQNSSYLKVRWEIFDNLKRQVVYTAETEGVDDYIRKPPRLNGAPISMELAFEHSMKWLFSQQEFIDLILGHSEVVDNQVSSFGSIDAAVTYGDNTSSFSKKIKRIKSAAATVRTISGHGSGFVISDQGYVLTNSHVVSNRKDVLVIIDGHEYPAKVIKTDIRRDVALLKIIDDYSGYPVEINRESVEWGEPIYVVGTPLDESLDFSISRGIISSVRNIKGLPYYQTDAAANPGNSGGPVFNNSGNVIGITVSGLFTQDGGSRNINYIIPIDDALKVIGF